MEEEIRELKAAFQEEILRVKSTQELEQLKVHYLGKKGPVQALMKLLPSFPPERRPQMGKEINDLKTEISAQIDAYFHTLSQEELAAKFSQDKIDITLPGRRNREGFAHPLSQMLEEVIEILVGMGFSVQYAPEIETEYYNYGGLNYPPDHPARDMQDTFYLDENTLLRSHTTNIQQRIMQSQKPPIRVICPGKCYRNETITARSHVFFHQVDAVYIDKGVTFADLLATKEEFYSQIFRQKVTLRVRPSYFPFVEPGMEIDIKCTTCQGEGCSLCKKTGWLEVCGAGMIHPEVLKEGGLDPKVYSGFAWGGGVERLFMLRHGIKDIRLFTENNLGFLSQFPSV